MPARRSRRIHRPVRPHPRPPRRTPTLRPAAHRHGDPMAPTELDQDAGTHLKGIAHDFSTHSVTVRTGNLQPERGLFWHPAPSTTDDQDVRVHHGFAGTGMRISPTEASTAGLDPPPRSPRRPRAARALARRGIEPSADERGTLQGPAPGRHDPRGPARARVPCSPPRRRPLPAQDLTAPRRPAPKPVAVRPSPPKHRIRSA